MIFFVDNPNDGNIATQEQATTMIAPAGKSGCGCGGHASDTEIQRRAKIISLMVTVLYALLIIYLFKKLTK